MGTFIMVSSTAPFRENFTTQARPKFSDEFRQALQLFSLVWPSVTGQKVIISLLFGPMTTPLIWWLLHTEITSSLFSAITATRDRFKSGRLLPILFVLRDGSGRDLNTNME